MWPGPYGDWGSRKYLLASLDQRLKRMGLEYVDIFYSHRPDPSTPLEETMSALDRAVRSGKALYAGISNYNPSQTRAAAKVLRELGTPCLIHQPKYSMFNRTAEEGLLDALSEHGIGAIAQIRALNQLAAERGQNLAQMALAWVLRDGRVTSALIGASRVEQIEQNVAALNNLAFAPNELARIDAIVSPAA